jgi:hypothetical protein
VAHRSSGNICSKGGSVPAISFVILKLTVFLKNATFTLNTTVASPMSEYCCFVPPAPSGFSVMFRPSPRVATIERWTSPSTDTPPARR